MQNEILNLLNENFDKARENNPRFSLRAFAKSIDIHPSAVSEILNGKRRITKKMGSKIMQNLGLSDEKIISILETAPKTIPRKNYQFGTDLCMNLPISSEKLKGIGSNLVFSCMARQKLEELIKKFNENPKLDSDYELVLAIVSKKNIQ